MAKQVEILDIITSKQWDALDAAGYRILRGADMIRSYSQVVRSRMKLDAQVNRLKGRKETSHG